VPHARARARSPRRCGWSDVMPHLFAVDDSLMVNVTVGCEWPLNRDSYQEPLNRDSYSALTATVTT
jgi:hypothetical protein